MPVRRPDRETPVEPGPFADVCDHCGHTALVRYRRASREVLTFCGHHAGRYGDTLTLAGWTTEVDLRPALAVAER